MTNITTKIRSWQPVASFILFLAAGCLLLYALIRLLMIPFSMQAVSSPTAASELRIFRLSHLEPLEKYQSDFSSHALFSKPKAVIQAPIRGIDELLKPYLLTGIIQGGAPEALIQNTATSQTYFLKSGETFDQFEVLEVRSHSVLIGYQNEQKELLIEGESK